VPGDSFDFYHVIMKTVSVFTCVAQAKGLTTSEAILSNISALTLLCNAEFAFSHFGTLPARGIFSNVIFDKVVLHTIGITQ
jgi:hypothetical protein